MSGVRAENVAQGDDNTGAGLLRQFLRGAAGTQLRLSGFKASGSAREARSFGCLLNSVSEFNCQQLIF